MLVSYLFWFRSQYLIVFIREGKKGVGNVETNLIGCAFASDFQHCLEVLDLVFFFSKKRDNLDKKLVDALC